MNVESQRKVILSMLQGSDITALDALRECGCMRLAARIWELRDMGHTIETDMVTIRGKRVARYRLVKDTLW